MKVGMEGRRTPEVGDCVTYVDPSGRDNNALVQIVWSETCINVVYLTQDESRKDQYGRQIVHETSVTHKNNGNVHGRYWRWLDEEPNEYKGPYQG